MSNWDVKILTLFPELYPGPLGISVIGKALAKKLWSLNAGNIRNYSLNKYRSVDDTPYGGGSGMIISADVLGHAIEAEFITNKNPIFYLSPRGQIFNQKVAQKLVEFKGINLICGRFEGIDERVFLEYNVEELSLGDFVLSCGDVAAYSIIDACVRLLPEVLDDDNTLIEESFGISSTYENLLEYPHYTRPQVWKGHEVPEILRSGNHNEIQKWRLQKAIEKTKNVRPDLLDRCKNGDKK